MQAKEHATTVMALYAVIVVMAVGIAVAPTLISSNVAQAAPSTKAVSGHGTTNTITCPISGIVGPFTLDFSAAKSSNGKLSGNWKITSVDPLFGLLIVKSGNINGGQIQNSKYIVTGIEDIDRGCTSSDPSSNPFGGQIPTTMSISGQCGTGVQINFQAADGEKATFTGNVACT
jgi:hypothetical protein